MPNRALPGVEHLLSLGHQRIALLAGPESSVSARARLAGWKTTLAQAGVEALRWRRATGARLRAMRKGISSAGAQLPEAILVANDQMALGVLRACAEKGVAVPGQISVVGFDDTADSAWFHLRSPPFGRRSARPVSAAWSG